MKPQRLAVAAALALLFGLLIYGAGCARSPLEIERLSLQPIDMVDGAGAQLWWVTLSMTNRSRSQIEIEAKSGQVEADTRHGWVHGELIWSPRSFGNYLEGGGSGKLDLLLPQGANACRLRLKYAYVPHGLDWLLVDWLGRRVPSLYRAPVLGKWMSRFYYQARSRHPVLHWRPMVTPKLALPPVVEGSVRR